MASIIPITLPPEDELAACQYAVHITDAGDL